MSSSSSPIFQVLPAAAPAASYPAGSAGFIASLSVTWRVALSLVVLSLAAFIVLSAVYTIRWHMVHQAYPGRKRRAAVLRLAALEPSSVAPPTATSSSSSLDLRHRRRWQRPAPLLPPDSDS